MIILPEGYQMAPSQKASKLDETLAIALAKAYYRQNLLDTRHYKLIDDMLHQRKINSSYMSRILRLNQFAPQIKKTILDGTQPRQLSLYDMQTSFPYIWDEQLKHF